MAKRKPSQLNLLLAIDKPVGITSHDVVARVRRAVNERRVGHAGTLDPLASGVVVVGVGQATRLLGQLTLDTKAYVADIRFGFETNTDDAEGEPTVQMEPKAELFDETFAREALAAFVGPQQQVPPAFSAISVNGVRAYKAARSGEALELEPRSVEVYAADLLAISTEDNAPVWTVAFSVSKGTYIRALARDLGRAAGNAAHVSALRRTASGGITLARCLDTSVLTPSVAEAEALDPVAALGIKPVVAGEDHLPAILCGKALPVASLQFPAGAPNYEEPVAVVVAGELRALAHYEGNSLRLTDVFPQGIAGVAL